MLASLWRRLAGRSVQLAPPLAARLAAWQARPEPALSSPARQTEWVVVDSETTGLSMQKARLIAIGAVVVRGGVIDLAESFECVLKQDAASDHASLVVHGIGGDEQLSGVAPEEALLRWLEFAGKRPLVAFHAEFDAHFMRRAYRDVLGIDYRPRWVDLAELVRVPYKLPHSVRGTPQGSLDHWLIELGIPVHQRHRAVADALAEAQLFLVLIDQLDSATQLSAERLQGLADFELARLARRMQGLE